MNTQTEIRFEQLQAPQALSVLAEQGRWHARDIEYISGTWDQIRPKIPSFKLEAYRLGPEEPVNPYLKNVVRQSLTPAERPTPVGTVSNTYSLAQHCEVIGKCLAAFEEIQVDPAQLRCELGLTPLGEWMNFRIYFPDSFAHTPADKEPLGLRLECFNSVDGSSRLAVVLGWLRFVCTNGLIIGETLCNFKDIHNKHLNLEKITGLISSGLKKVDKDKVRMATWEKTALEQYSLRAWVDTELPKRWGKKAATRIYAICQKGHDVELLDPFESAAPSQKQTKFSQTVPGSVIPAANLYDLSQALSWVASSRPNPEERMQQQKEIPNLIQSIKKFKAA
jgi:hypothetical protein